jgi:hypothetical protein
MAFDPKARSVTLFYPGGSVQATKGLIDFLFPSWSPSWLPNGESGTGKRPFGSRQRTSRASGEAMTLVLQNGEEWVCRITGTHTRFIQTLLGQGATDQVLQVYSERGSVYGPNAGTLNPAP